MSSENFEEGRYILHSRPLGTVTEEMVQRRAREIAIINGRPRGEVLDSDVDQAQRELTQDKEVPLEQETLESAPESERWDPVPGSFGRKFRHVPDLDEPSDNEKLTGQGLEEAEHDEMLSGSEESARRDEEGE